MRCKTACPLHNARAIFVLFGKPIGLFFADGNLTLLYCSLQRGMITLGLIRIRQSKLSHRYIEFIV